MYAEDWIYSPAVAYQAPTAIITTMVRQERQAIDAV